MTHSSNIRDRLNHAANHFRGEFRIDRQRERFARGCLTYGEVAGLAAEFTKTRQEMQRRRIVHGIADALVSQMLKQRVALRTANHKLVVDMPMAGTVYRC